MLHLTLLLLAAGPATPLETARQAQRQLAAAASRGASKVVEVSADVFDDDELMRRVLANDAARLDDAQRTELRASLGRLLRVTWARRAAEAAGQRYQLVFTSQEVTGDEATVTGTLTTDAPHPVALTLVRRGRWRIVDVSVEGSSAVAAWSQQLHAMLERHGAAALVTRVREQANAVALAPTPDAGSARVTRTPPDPMELLLFGALQASGQPSSAPTGLLLLQLWSD